MLNYSSIVFDRVVESVTGPFDSAVYDWYRNLIEYYVEICLI